MLPTFLWVKREFLYKKSPILGSFRHLIDKAGSTTSFSSEDVFPSVSLSVKKLKLFINDSDSKENENNIDVIGWILTGYIQ